jgi:L-aminopeptidase/D-esterase-like protein
MRFLEERDLGFATRYARVPIVPAAVLFDLGLGASGVRPSAAAGYAACVAADSRPVVEGNVGAGTGATVGKVLGPAGMMKGGLGGAAWALGDGSVVAALVAVNAVGDVIAADGSILAGALDPATGAWVDTVRWLAERRPETPAPGLLGGNTTIGVIATDRALSKAEANKVAQMAHDGLARAIRPVHTMGDGDALFCLATGRRAAGAGVNAIGVVAAEVTARAVRRAVEAAEGLFGVPSVRDLGRGG